MIPSKFSRPSPNTYLAVLLLAVAFSPALLQATAVPFIQNPLVPSGAVPGSPSLVLTLNGAGFSRGSTVLWNGRSVPAKFVSNTQLKATVSSSLMAAAGTATLTVVNGGALNKTSNPQYFSISNPNKNVGFQRTEYLDNRFDGPYGIVAADLNGDGLLDLVEVLPLVNAVNIYLGEKGGKFILKDSPVVGSGPEAVMVGDFNGDGKLDLAAASNRGNISVLLGNGDGTFQSLVSYSTGGGPRWLVAADFNGDGKLDLASSSESLNSASILLGNGDGTFQAAAEYSAGGTPLGITVGDFNGDNKLDLALTTTGTTLSVLLGNGDGSFQSPVAYAVGDLPVYMTTADLNGDGHLDLVCSSIGNLTLSVLIGNGDGTFQSAVAYSTAGNASAVQVADINGDGKPDLVATVWSATLSGIAVYYGKGDGTFGAGVTYIAGDASDFPDSVAIGDFNGDGRPDMAVDLETKDALSVMRQIGH